MISTLTVFFVVAAVIIIGLLANILFKKTGWPEILFLIFTGVILGPVLNVFLKSDLLPILPLVSTFTLLMVLFRGGLELNLSEIAAGSFRSIFQTLSYFAMGTTVITLFTHFVIGWPVIDGLLLGSMISQIGEVVIIPMAKKLGLQNQSATLLSIESVMSSIVCIVFFFAFLATKTGDGTFNTMNVVASIITKFAVGIVIGVAMALPWLRVLFALEKNELTYIATLGYILACYAISESLLGSGALSVLAFGIILGNYTQVLSLLRVKPPSPSFSNVTDYLTRFQTELSFILRAFFFVLLGLIFEVSTSSLVTGFSIGLPIVALLLGARLVAVSASTWKSPMASEKKIIVGLCAHGLTPALLSFIVLQYSFPNAYLFPLIVTSVIITTNIVTSVSSFMYRRKKSVRDTVGSSAI